MRVIKFGAPWCQPCKDVSNLLKDNGIKVEAFDVDEYRDLAIKYSVRTIPTILILDSNDEVAQRMTGSRLTFHELSSLKAIA